MKHRAYLLSVKIPNNIFKTYAKDFFPQEVTYYFS